MGLFDRDERGQLKPPPGPVRSEAMVLGPQQFKNVVAAGLKNAQEIADREKGKGVK